MAAGCIWTEAAEIPGDGDLKTYLKTHERYGDLHSQSSQNVLEELSEAFTSWYGQRQTGTDRANPPGYRKHRKPTEIVNLLLKCAPTSQETKIRTVR